MNFIHLNLDRFEFCVKAFVEIQICDWSETCNNGKGVLLLNRRDFVNSDRMLNIKM